MILVPYSYNGTVINKDIGSSTDYDAYYERSLASLQIQTNPSYIKRAGTYPVMSGKEFQPATLAIQITLLHDFTALHESINQLFDTKDETPRQFICVDTEDSNKQYYVYASPKQVARDAAGGANVTVVLALDDPIWQSVTQNTQTFSVTDTTGTTDITINGNDYSYPIFEITPTAQPVADYLYNLYVQVLPTSTDPWNNRFLDITGATDTTFDTAALVSGGKMQADGSDLRVFRDGVEVDRWLDGINTTDTHVIVSCDMPGAHNMTLKTAIGATDTVSEIVLNYTTANKAEISALPNTGRLIVDSAVNSTDTEEYTYTARTVTATKLAFTVNARSVRSTSAFAHAPNANVRYLPYDFNIVYGNASATAPTVDDTKKPIVDLTSRNWSFVYTNFYDESATRPNEWTPLTRKVSSATLSRSDVYTSTDDEGDTDPSTALGIATYTYLALGAWKSDVVTLGWLGFFPDRIASVGPVNGAQSQSTSYRPATVAMQRSASLTATFTSLWTISAQSATDYATWTTWTKASTDSVIPAGQKYLKFIVTGTQAGTTDTYTKVEASGVTVGLTNYPKVMLRTEQNNYKLDCTFTNAATGESFRVNYPMELNETLYIDTDPDFPTAKYKGQLVNGSISLSSIRSAWLKLQPGLNTINFETNLSGASDITAVIKWRDRANYL